jgi:crotonobetainyl-CoA:carnitine CoA-transferase CaiB-like acyl-CoA transferase
MVGDLLADHDRGGVEVAVGDAGKHRTVGDPQALARGAVTAVGASRAPRLPIRFSEAEIAAERPPPRHDERGAAIRAALAGGADWPDP